MTLWPERLRLARTSDDCIELFIEGPLESFAQSVIGQGLEFGRYREIRDAREFSALVVRSGPGEGWLRPMAHLTYEAVQAIHQDPDITNESLLVAVGPFLRLVVGKEVLSTEHQVGLTGELIFLQEVLNAASALGVAGGIALSRWTGWDMASRDFKGGRIAVEVKATGGSARHHWVHPMYRPCRNPVQGRRCSFALSASAWIEAGLTDSPAQSSAFLRAFRPTLMSNFGIELVVTEVRGSTRRSGDSMNWSRAFS